jgi:IS30 family transposase
MACELGVSQATVSRELKRGRTRQLDYQRNYSEQYIAASGARVYQENRSNSHTQDYEKYSATFLEALPKALAPKKGLRLHSVDTFVHTYRKEHPEERVPCTKTVYRLIDAAVLPIQNIDLPMKNRMRPRKKTVSGPKGHNVKHLGRSIEERPQEVLSREEFGHREVDLVLGKKTKNEPVIITMVERNTRYLLTKKVWGKNAEIVQRSVFDLMEKQGIERSKSLTTDNGSEFSNLSYIEKSAPTVQVFFTHAYASWEKGSSGHDQSSTEEIDRICDTHRMSIS